MAASLSFLGVLGFGATFLAIACYYLWVISPYSKFPSHRFDIRIIYWLLKGQPIRSKLLQEIENVSKKYQKEGMFVAWIGSPNVVVYGEDAAKALLNDPEIVDKPMLYSMFKTFQGSAILTSNGEEWRKQKKIVHPAFQLRSLKDMIPTFNKHSRDLVKTLSELNKGTADDLLHILRDFALRMFLESSLGLRERGEKHAEYLCMLENTVILMKFLTERMMKPWLYPDFALHIFPSGRRILKVHEEVKTTALKLLDDMKEKILSSPKDFSESSDRRPKLFGEILIKEHLKDPSFTMHDVISQTVFMAAAESMRIYTVSPLVGRHPNKDVQIGKYKIPKHSSVVIPIFCMHKNPEIFSDPEKFDPERFSTKDSGMKQRSYAPFAEGARPCPGKTYSLLEMKIILSHILRKFKVVSFDCWKDVELSFEVSAVPLKPLRMQFIPRDSSAPNI